MSIVNSRLNALSSDKEKSSYLAKIRANKEELVRMGESLFKTPSVEPEVAVSWVASRNAGVDPYALTNSEGIDYEELSKRLAENAETIAVVDEAIESFRGVLRKVVTSVFYADSEGVVLYLFEGDISNGNYRQFGTRVGGLWREDVTGTSAVSLCVKHQDVVQLVGPEHYRVVMQDHLTTAVPIHDGEGEFVGVLAMTTLHNKVGTGLSYAQPYMLGLSMALASSIEGTIKLKTRSLDTETEKEKDEYPSRGLREGVWNLPRFDDFVGSSVSLSNAKKLAKQAAATGMNVLISGETGVGKLMLAKIIAAERGARPESLMRLSFSGIPESIVEEEVFGKESLGGGAEKVGILEQAKDGVLVIHDVGDIPAKIQHALLDAIEEQSFCRVGGSVRVPLGSLQIVSTSEIDLIELVRSGKLRSDLAITLSSVLISIPPLRERRDDERMLIGYLIKRESERLGVAPPRLTSRAMQVLLAAQLPGNVRQLRNILQCAIVVSERQTIEAEDLPLDIEEGASNGLVDTDGNRVLTLKEAEQKAIEHALEFTNGNIREAGRALGISRSTLYRKMEEYCIVRK